MNPIDLSKEILKGNIQALSLGITLVESLADQDQQNAKELIKLIHPHIGNSIRIGVTGVPGSGKSTLIESFGLYLIEKGHKVAVLAVDPSSELTKGSILGDKTRMNDLALAENAFIRPTASSGSLGGVARKTRESMYLCEAAGFDYILIETVGVGQSEIEVNSMTDFFLLLMLAGAGDELQGIKRGIMEMADLILINKADGDNIAKANLARSEFAGAMHYFPLKRKGWAPKVETFSSILNTKLEKVYQITEDFKVKMQANGNFESNRKKQDVYWFEKSIKIGLIQIMESNKLLSEEKKKLLEKIKNSEMDSFLASDELLKLIKSKYDGI